MVRVRKLVLAIAAASALSSGMAHALGVGELKLQSALNQPLVAEIDLQDVGDLTPQELRSLLASPEEFSKAGVERPYFLTDLKFTPVIRPNGRSVIRVTSSKPVREPYLNFLMEVLWPSGRVLREYTLLLDPPLYSPQAAAVPQLPVAAPAPSASAPRPAPSPAPAAASGGVGAAPSAAGQSGEYRIASNDTLWEIAQRVRGSGSVNQAMLAIQDLNPDAFIGGNINRIKSGQVLRLPDAEQIGSRTPAQAQAQVAEQNASWRQRRSAPAAARQLDATRRSGTADAPAEVQSQDSLKLLAADAGQATAGSEGGSASSQALSNRLAVTQESLDSTRRENDELKDRMGDLQSQLDKLQRLIQLKDDQLAKLQADLGAPAADTTAADPTSPGVAADGASAETAPAAPGAPGETAPPTAAAPGEPAADAAGQPPSEAPEAAAAPAPAQPAEPAPAELVTAEPQPVAEDGALDKLLANPMWLGLIGGSLLLALLLVLLILSRRNARKEAEQEERFATPADDDGQHFDSDMALSADSLDDLPDEFPEADAPQEQERTTAQTGDALGEADIYIAYGRFNQAAELLHNAINDEPQRADLRLKLMEVYAELGDRDGFIRQEQELREIGGAPAEVEQLKSRYPAMLVLAGAGAFAAGAATQKDDDFDLDDLTFDEPAPAPAPVNDADSFDLDLTALEAELERDLQVDDKASELGDLPALDDRDELPASADVDIDFAIDEALQDKEPGGELADFSLDLDAPSTPAAAAEDEFLLSLDDELTKEPANDSEVEPPVVAAPPADDFDLPADFDLSLGDEESAPAPETSFAAQLDEVTAELDQLAESLEQQGRVETPDEPLDLPPLDDDEDFDFLAGTDETATKLDLARAYIDMGDTDGARDILDEVIAEGNDEQQQDARELIGKLV